MLKTPRDSGNIELLAGYDSSIFAFGETATGKTHTANLIHEPQPRCSCYGA